MNNKLNSKDFILTGALTALMWIICMIIGGVMQMISPITNVFYPTVVSVVNGIVMMLLLSKTPKKGVLTICGILQGTLYLLFGALWLLPVCIILGGIGADLIFMSKKNITKKHLMGAFGFFSGMLALGAVGPVFFLRDAFVELMSKNNLPAEYIDGLVSLVSAPMLIVVVLAAVIGGVVGSLLGQAVLKKHFIKAGLVSAE